MTFWLLGSCDKTIGKMKRCLVSLGVLISFAAAAQEQSEVPVLRFPALPKTIQNDLRRRGCTVPQPPGKHTLANVISGNFRRPHQTDWAVLCDVRSKKESVILVYWNGNPSRPAVLGRIPLAADRCGREIGAVGKANIMEHYRAYGGPKPPVIDHQGIDVGICEKASTISYFHRHRWLTLTGAD